MSADKPKGSWGGRRAGAGAKAADGAVVVAQVTAYVDQDTLDLMRELGKGNDALGIRLMAQEVIRLRKLSKGIVSIKHKEVPTPAQNAPAPRNPFLRTPTKEPAPAPNVHTGPAYRTGVAIDNDWEVERGDFKYEGSED